MNIKYKSASGDPSKPGLILFFQSEDDPLKRQDLSPHQRLIQTLRQSGAFKASYLDSLPIKLENENWLILVGLGQAQKLTEARILEAGAKAAQQAKSLALREISISLPPVAYPPEKVLELLALGVRLALGERPTYKTNPEPATEIKNITYLGSEKLAPINRPQDILAKAEVIAQAQLQARIWADQPANYLYPETMAQEAVQLAHRHKLKVTVWDEARAEKEGAGALLAVGQGSQHPPRLVILEYHGAPKTQAPTALVGKGITFDSGGICLKPAENMSQMKTDMSGAASVLAIMGAVATLKLPLNLVGLLALAENMPDGKAYRPGDVITTLSGQTVEIVNTDAEGRLVLADALTLAQKFKPARIIDLATLTGACVVALGDDCAGLFTNQPELGQDLVTAGQTLGETLWPMPLLEEYEDNLKSDLADFKQAAARSGGAINAALFLRRFVKGPWAHLDIAGTARRNRTVPSGPEGASGFGVRTILSLLTTE